MDLNDRNREDSIATVKEVYTFMNDRNIILSFHGDLTHVTITALLATLKKVLSYVEAEYLVKKRLYNVLVECLDNISRHNLPEGDSMEKINAPSTIFAISHQEKQFVIHTGNYIHASRTESLARKIETVNTLDKEGLQELYRKKLLENPPVGGGLGIIDISLKTGCKISYEFKPVGEEMFFFVLQATINK